MAVKFSYMPLPGHWCPGCAIERCNIAAPGAQNLGALLPNPYLMTATQAAALQLQPLLPLPSPLSLLLDLDLLHCCCCGQGAACRGGQHC
jgi:hypothetical protein